METFHKNDRDSELFRIGWVLSKIHRGIFKDCFLNNLNDPDGSQV